MPQRMAPLIRISRCLERLEARAKEVAAAVPEPHTICFVNAVDKRVSSTLTWENGKEVWTHFDPPGSMRNSNRWYSRSRLKHTDKSY